MTISIPKNCASLFSSRHGDHPTWDGLLPRFLARSSETSHSFREIFYDQALGLRDRSFTSCQMTVRCSEIFRASVACPIRFTNYVWNAWTNYHIPKLEDLKPSGWTSWKSWYRKSWKSPKCWWSWWEQKINETLLSKKSWFILSLWLVDTNPRRWCPPQL